MTQDVIFLNLRISMWGITRTLPDHEYDVEADKTMTRANKRILEAGEYDFLLQLKRQVHRTIETKSLPGEALRAGVYPVSINMVEEIDKILLDFQVRWTSGVASLGNVWETRIQEVEEKLGQLYHANDYPAWEKVWPAFQVKWNWFTMQTPDSLSQVSQSFLKREQEKAKAQVGDMMTEIRDGLRIMFRDLVEAFLEKLQPAADGTKKVLRGTDRLLEFMGTFNKQNVAGDQDIEALVGQLREIISDKEDVENLRKNESYRTMVKETMGSVKVILDSLISDAPTRKIVLRD